MTSLHPRLPALAVLAALCLAAPAARALDLETALAEVLRSNPMLAARGEMTAAARARIAPAGAWSEPMLEAGLQNVPTNGRLDMDPMTMRMVGLEQRVPVSGANRLARGAATLAWRAEGRNESAAALDMLSMAWERYADAYWAGVLAHIGEDHRGVMDRMVGAADARYRAGRGRLDEVLRAEADRARMLADLAAFTAEASAARARLDALRGRDPGTDADTLAAPPDSLAAADSPAWGAAAAHPRLEALEREAASRRASARAMRRMSWPDLDLRASYGRRSTLEDGMAQDDMWSASVGVMLPVFAASRERAQAAEMDAMARAADHERRSAALEFEAGLADARARAAAARRTARLLADTVVVAQQRALDASWIAYEAGTTDLSRVLESAHALYAESVALVRARQDFAHACARIVAVTGSGDAVGVRLPVLEKGEAR